MTTMEIAELIALMRRERVSRVTVTRADGGSAMIEIDLWDSPDAAQPSRAKPPGECASCDQPASGVGMLPTLCRACAQRELAG